MAKSGDRKNKEIEIQLKDEANKRIQRKYVELGNIEKTQKEYVGGTKKLNGELKARK